MSKAMAMTTKMMTTMMMMMTTPCGTRANGRLPIAAVNATVICAASGQRVWRQG